MRPLAGVAFRRRRGGAGLFAIAAFDFRLVYVETQLWGASAVTLVVAIVGIVAPSRWASCLRWGGDRLPAVRADLR
ncbi:MAG: hypothetical protein HPM95_15515 [Alphaproteobacteria bacterium]|nr:hypothetical protein [Alphaproteobacteria bacterium]